MNNTQQIDKVTMNKYICALSKTHILKDGIVLPCDFRVCLNCIEKYSSYNGLFQCRFCDQLHNIRLNALKVCEIDDDMPNIIAALFPFSIGVCNQCMLRLKGRQENFLNSFENYVDYIEGEIEVRIESLYNEFDKLHERLNEFIDRTTESNKKLIKRNKLNKKGLLSKNSIKIAYKYENRLKKLIFFKRINIAVNNKGYSQNQIDKFKCIGVLKGPYVNLNKLAVDQQMPYFVNFGDKCKSLCAMSPINDSQLAITDFKQNEIYILDRNLHITDSVKSVQRLKLKNYYGICASADYSCDSENGNDDNVYLCDLEYSRILITNNKLNMVKKILIKTDNFNEFNCPRDICYFNERVYLLDQGERCVIQFTKHGQCIKHFSITGLETSLKSPVSICASDDTIIIIDWKKSIFVFDFNGFLKQVIDQNLVTSICTIYEYLITHGEDGSLCCYKRNGDGLYNVEFKQYFSELKYRSESMIIFNDKLIISFGWQRILAYLKIR